MRFAFLEVRKGDGVCGAWRWKRLERGWLATRKVLRWGGERGSENIAHWPCMEARC